MSTPREAACGDVKIGQFGGDLDVVRIAFQQRGIGAFGIAVQAHGGQGAGQAQPRAEVMRVGFGHAAEQAGGLGQAAMHRLPPGDFVVQRRRAALGRGLAQDLAGLFALALVDQQGGHVDQHRRAAAGAGGDVQHFGGVLGVAGAAPQPGPGDQHRGIGRALVVERCVDGVGPGTVAGGFARLGGLQARRGGGFGGGGEV
jgi:hypothetical protein